MTSSQFQNLKPGTLLHALSPRFGDRYYIIVKPIDEKGHVVIHNIADKETYPIDRDGWVACNAKIVG